LAWAPAGFLIGLVIGSFLAAVRLLIAS